MSSGIGVLRQLDREWEQIGSGGRRSLRRWAAEDPSVGGFESVGALVDKVNERGRAEESDALLFGTAAHGTVRRRGCPDGAAGDDAGSEEPRPRSSRTAVRGVPTTAAIMVAAMWERIRGYPVDRRPRKVRLRTSHSTPDSGSGGPGTSRSTDGPRSKLA